MWIDREYMNKKGSWVSYYVYSRNARKAIYITIPHEDSSGYACGMYYKTEKEAIDSFSNSLGKHVIDLIEEVKTFTSNEPLRKRLIKYGNMEALQALDNFERLVKAIPVFKGN